MNKKCPECNGTGKCCAHPVCHRCKGFGEVPLARSPVKKDPTEGLSGASAGVGWVDVRPHPIDLYWKWRIWRLDRWAERNKDWLPPPPPLDDLLRRIDEEADRD